MYDTLLFLHLIAAFLLAVTVVTYTAVALGAPAGGRTLFVADRCWDVGGLGTLVLGIWLALNLDQYDFWDGWILGAIALWFVATGLGQSTQRRWRPTPSADIAVMHWLRTLTVLGLLVADGLEAGRMTLLGAIRPDDWDLPLFLHILGAMTLVGALVLGRSRWHPPAGGVRRRACARLPRPAARRDPRLDRHARRRAVDRIEGGARRPRRPAGLGRHRLPRPPSPRSSC